MILEADSLLRKNPDKALKILTSALSMAEKEGISNLIAETEYVLARAYITNLPIIPHANFQPEI